MSSSKSTKRSTSLLTGTGILAPWSLSGPIYDQHWPSGLQSSQGSWVIYQLQKKTPNFKKLS